MLGDGWGVLQCTNLGKQGNCFLNRRKSSLNRRIINTKSFVAHVSLSCFGGIYMGLSFRQLQHKRRAQDYDLEWRKVRI